jgi:hypothetical protein
MMIEINLAIVTDVTWCLRQATYTVEGDGLLSVITSDVLMRTQRELNLSGEVWIGPRSTG